jgi:hypothetical protein
MVFKLPLVKAREYSFFNPYSIVSFICMGLAVILYLKGPVFWPLFMKNWPIVPVNILFALFFLNGGYAIIRPGLMKPDDIGTLLIDDQNKIVIINEDVRSVELPFEDINRIEFDIKGYKNLMDNLH